MGLRSHVDCWTRTSNIIRPLAACLLGCAALAVSQSTSAPGDITISELQDRVGELELALASGGFIASRDLDTLFVLVSAVMVFFMQVGFAMLEVGSVHPKNTKAVLIKNIGDASIGALSWWLVGYSFAEGKAGYGNAFIGSGAFAFSPKTGNNVQESFLYAVWLFGWSFAATATTIVSGAVAERIYIGAYVMYAVGISSFIFPVVHHWVWSPQGWASYSRDEGPLLLGCGAIDFSGSGVVHCTGGLLAFIGAKLAEPRVGRFSPDGTPRKMVAQSPALVTLGTLILWVGWFFFNASGGGSFTGQSVVAARSMVNTAIAPAAAAMTSFVISYTLEKRFNMVTTTNSIISGLVAITAGCATVYTEGALLIGIIAAIVYSLASALMLRLRVDDVVDACAAHLFSGMWGLVATGLFTSKEGFSQSISSDSVLVDRCCGLFYGCSGHLLGANLIYLAALLAWVGVTGVLLFQTIKYTVGLRVSSEMEDSGMDKTRHGDTHASMRHAIARTLNAMGSHGVSTAVSRRPSMNSTTDQPVIPPNSSSANWG